MIRVCFVFDVDTDDPAVAYGKVVEVLERTTLDYESADSDWFDPDGNELYQRSIEEARQRYWDKRLKEN